VKLESKKADKKPRKVMWFAKRFYSKLSGNVLDRVEAQQLSLQATLYMRK